MHTFAATLFWMTALGTFARLLAPYVERRSAQFSDVLGVAIGVGVIIWGARVLY